MALVLIKQLDGKGNYDSVTGRLLPLRDVLGPNGAKRKVRTGGDALVLDDFGKAADMVFRPWAPVPVPSAKQEAQILDYINRVWPTDPPIVQLNLRSPKVLLEYLRRHPEERPASEPGSEAYFLEVAALMERWQSPQGPPTNGAQNVAAVKFDDAVTMSEAQIRALMDKQRPVALTSGAVDTTEGEKPISGPGAPANAPPAEMNTYDRVYTDNRARGRSPQQAAYAAGKAAKAEVRREGKAVQPTAPAPAPAAPAPVPAPTAE